MLETLSQEAPAPNPTEWSCRIRLGFSDVSTQGSCTCRFLFPAGDMTPGNKTLLFTTIVLDNLMRTTQLLCLGTPCYSPRDGVKGHGPAV